MPIYTKYGDTGNTQLLGGQQTRKDDLRVAVCGGLDEVSAVLGMAAAAGTPDSLTNRLRVIQSELLTIGACVAAIGASTKMELPRLGAEHVARLESELDLMDSGLPELTHFVLPGGVPAAATLHVARAVCRRTERDLVSLAEAFAEFDASLLLQWLNRLGDWCFVAARHVNHAEGTDEPVWRGTDESLPG